MVTCQKNEKKPCAVKKHKFKKKNNSNEPLRVSLHYFVHDKVKHGVEIDGDETNRYTNNVVKVIQGKKSFTGFISQHNVDYLDEEDQRFVKEKKFRGSHHKFNVSGCDFWLGNRQEADKRWRPNWKFDIFCVAKVYNRLFSITENNT